MLMRLGKDDPQDVTIASVGSAMSESDSYVVICLCPKCGEFIDEDVEQCPKCRAVLADNGKDNRNTRSDILETYNSIYLCSSCGAFISEEHTHCLACGAERAPIPAEFGATVKYMNSDKTIQGYADSLLETTPSLYICIKCGAFLSPKASKCGICGADASETAKTESGQETGMIDDQTGEFFSDVLSNRGELSICGQCGAFMSFDSDSCSMCGVEKTVMLVCEEVEFEAPNEEDRNSSSGTLLMCAECGAFVSSNAEFCTSCGMEMSIDEPYEEPVAEAEPAAVSEVPDNLVVLERMNTKAKEQITMREPVHEPAEAEEQRLKVCRKWWRKKAWALIKLGRYSEAMDSLNSALESEPNDVELLTEKAHLYYIINRYEEAAALYKEILEIQPRNISLWNKLGNALFRLNHTKESQICYEKALSLDSNNSETIINRGYLFLKQRKYDEAMGYARRVAA